MPLVIDPTAYVIGPARVYYRAVGVLTPWTSIGATLDDAVLRVLTTRFVPDNISGALGTPQGLDVIRRVHAEVEFTMPEIAGSKLGLAVPGARVTAEAHADAGGSPLSTTLAAAASAGDTNIKVTAVTNAAVGDFVRIADATNPTEYRQLVAVGTAGSGGTGLDFRDPLLWSHANAQAVVETTGDYRTLIESPAAAGRLPDSAYNEWALVASNGHGYQELRLPRAVSQTDSAEVTVGDNSLSGIRCVIGARYDGTDMSKSPFKLWAPAN